MILAKEKKVFSDFEKDIPLIIRETLERYDFVITDFVTNKQLDQKREDGKGVSLGKYSVNYARFRIKKGLQAEAVDTHFTGKFHASIFLETDSESFNLSYNVDYGEHLVKRYGVDILRVQEIYLKEFVENYILPQLKNELNDRLSKI